MGLAITSIYAGLCALICIRVSLAIIRRRKGAKISLGDAGDPELQRLTRAHANAVEWMPIFLIMLAAAESLGAPWFALHPIAFAFVVGRAMHAQHFMTNRQDLQLRVIGMHLTIWPTLILALGSSVHGLVNIL